MLTLQTYPDWHSPKNESCPHNADPTEKCRCKRPRKYKPYRVVRVHDDDAPRGVDNRIAVQVWPQNGVIELREYGRRKSYSITAGELYKRLVWGAALSARAAKKRNHKGGRK